jgi:hypothetical protein
VALTACARNLVKIGARIVRHGRYVVFPAGRGGTVARCSPRSYVGSNACAEAAAVLGMRSRAMNDDNLTGRCVPDRPTTAPRRPKRRSRAQWESRVKCEPLHTGRPPSSNILALCRTEPSLRCVELSHMGNLG